MNFFRSNDDVKKRQELNDKAAYVRRGGSLDAFRPDDVIELQNYAMDIKDVKLYDYLERFWCGKKSGVQ